MSNMIPVNRNRSMLIRNNWTNMIDDFFRDSRAMERNLQMDTFKIDVMEEDNAYRIEADLPGFSRDDIKLELEDNRLTISVEKEENTEEKTDKYLHRERKSSSMSRCLSLKDADLEKSTAKLEDGVLRIIAPRMKPEDNKKTIELE